MLKKFLSSIGIGAARVDLVLPRSSYRAGEQVTGTLHIESGKVDQEVSSIYLQLHVRSRYGDGNEAKNVHKILDAVELSGPLRIAAGDPAREIPVRYTLPLDIPITTRRTRLFLITGLDISMAVDPSDTDEIVVLPDWRREAVMRALERELGFRPAADFGEYNGRHQEFEYKPVRFMRGRLDELELVFRFAPGGVHLYVEIDRRGGLLELLDLDESRVRCFVPDEVLRSVPETARFIADFISRHY